MKIVYLSSAGFPSEITHTLSMLRVCKAMSEQGHKVLLTGRRLEGHTNAEVFKYYGMSEYFELSLERIARFFNNRWTRFFELPSLFLAWHFRSTLRHFAPDLVYSRLTLLELLAVPCDLPLIYEMHSPGALTQKGLKRWLFLYLMQRQNVRHIVVTTNALQAYLHDHLPDIEIRVARLSAEAPVNIEPSQMKEFREQTLQGQQFEFHAGYTGFLHKVRGIGVVIKVASLSPDIAFHIVGGTPDAVLEWQKFASEQNVPGNVFFYGHRPAAEIPCFLSCFDFFLAPLQIPSQPLTFMSPLKVPQYLAYGKPIIASDVLPHQEQLKHNSTALLVPPDDPSAWAQALQNLCSSSALRSKLGNGARTYHQAELLPERRLEIILRDASKPLPATT